MYDVYSTYEGRGYRGRPAVILENACLCLGCICLSTFGAMSLWCCDCCLKQKMPAEFQCKMKGNVKPKSICSSCYWEATLSTDVDFLEHYATVVAQLRRNLTFMRCRRCELTLSSSFFSEDQSRKSKKSLICKDCHAEGCELSRIKKRIWAEEDEHYKVPGGMGASKKRRLEPMYKEPQFPMSAQNGA